MSDNLTKVKELRELTGAGIKIAKLLYQKIILILKNLLNIYVKKE